MYICDNLVGFNCVKELLAGFMKDARAYQMCRLPLPNLLLELDKGNGQSYLTESVTRFLKENDLRSFGSMDNYLEYHLDGSLKQLNNIFRDIRVNAVYSSYYEGVVTMDVTALHQSINEEPMEIFVKEMKEVMRHATVVLFLSPECPNKQALKKALTERLGLRELQVIPYSDREYVLIMAIKLRRLGIRIHNPERQKPLMIQLVQDAGICSAKEAVCLAQKLAFKADYSGFVPELSVEGTEEFLQSVKEQLTVQEVAR